MNAPRLTDAQISQALRAHLPDRAQAGLRERILEAAETTNQQRALPSFLGALSEADPLTRRRSLLIAAALLVALALAATVAVGALRILEGDPFRDLSLVPPTDLAVTPLHRPPSPRIHRSQRPQRTGRRSVPGPGLSVRGWRPNDRCGTGRQAGARDRVFPRARIPIWGSGPVRRRLARDGQRERVAVHRPAGLRE